MVDEVLEAHGAGSPTDEAVRWTDLEPVQLALITGDVDPHERDQHFRLKEDLVALSRRLGLRLQGELYPPYTAKWHLIEHRLFSHIERRLSGVILDSHQNRPHGHATPARYPLRAGTKVF